MHEKFLLAALEEAKLGEGFCAPNPSVGAVAVKNGDIIARAWHRGAGSPHAERLLIDQLPLHETDVTLYVTLEPCNHYGRTPPCVDAIIKYGFSQVVFAYLDPNPVIAANRTPESLRESGIPVIQHRLSEIDAFYQPYQYWTQTKTPWVTAKMAQTMDGKIGASEGARVMLSNNDCQLFTHQMRRKHDVILTTAQTIHQDNPQLNVRYTCLRDEPVVCSKPIAILDRTLSLNPASNIFLTAEHCHVFYDAALPAPERLADRTYHPVSTRHGLLNLQEVMQQLGRLGFHSVWLEAGGRLFTAMHQAHLVHRTHLYLVPRVLGDNAVSAYHDADVFNHPQKSVSWMPMGDNMIATLDWERARLQV